MYPKRYLNIEPLQKFLRHLALFFEYQTFKIQCVFYTYVHLSPERSHFKCPAVAWGQRGVRLWLVAGQPCSMKDSSMHLHGSASGVLIVDSVAGSRLTLLTARQASR